MHSTVPITLKFFAECSRPDQNKPVPFVQSGDDVNHNPDEGIIFEKINKYKSTFIVGNHLELVAARIHLCSRLQVS
jgi:hypothetical protein